MPPYVGREGRRCDHARSIESSPSGFINHAAPYSFERRPDASPRTAEGGCDANHRSYRLRPSRRLALTSIACDINDLAQPHAAPVLTAPERIVDYRLIDGRFFAFMAANCRDLDVKLASSRRETVMKGIEAYWNWFNPEI